MTAPTTGEVKQPLELIGSKNPVDFSWTTCQELTFTCVGDVSDGSIPDTAINAANLALLSGTYLSAVIINPGTPNPTPASDVTLKDQYGFDVLGGQGTNALGATASKAILPMFAGYLQCHPLTGTLTLSVGNQSVSLAQFNIVCVFTKKPTFLGFGNPIHFTNDQTTLATTTFTINGTNGKTVTMHHGDESETVISMDGSTHDYDIDYGVGKEGTYNVSFTGDLDEITEFTCQETTISGDGSWMADQFSVTKLTLLDLTGTDITINTSDLVLFTAMISMILRSCSNVTGDIADFNSMTALTSLFLDSSGITDFTDGVLPDRDACEQDLANLGISSTEISNYFTRLNTASTSSTETVDAGGTTPAPNVAGREGILNLVVKGWTVVASNLEKYGSVTQANMKQSLVDGTAFIDIGIDISTDYAGADTGDHDHFIEVKSNSTGKIASGHIGAKGGGETFGADLLPDNTAVSDGGTEADDTAGWVETLTPDVFESSIVDPNVGTYHFRVDNNSGGYMGCRVVLLTQTLGSLYKLELDVKKVDGVSPQFLLYSGSGATTIVYSPTIPTPYTTQTVHMCNPEAGPSGQVRIRTNNGDGEYYLDNASYKAYTDCHTNGVHIISTVDGSTQNWADVEAGFDYNDVSGYTYAIYSN